MKNKNLVLTSFAHGIITVAYIILVSWIMFNGEKWFGKTTNFWGPFAMILLFVLSAAIVGYFVVGKPIQLYIDNQKKKLSDFFSTPSAGFFW